MLADQINARLNLARHPKGGVVLPNMGWHRSEGSPHRRCHLFLLKAGERSHWHRVDTDKVWFYHAGAPLILLIGFDLAKDHRLCPDVLAIDAPQTMVPTGWWQAARTTGDYTLVSCLVTPGFQFAGFELAASDFDLPILRA